MMDTKGLVEEINIMVKYCEISIEQNPNQMRTEWYKGHIAAYGDVLLMLKEYEII